MRIEPASMDDLGALVEAWVTLARDQQHHGSHLLADENRDPVRMRLAGHIVDETLLVARTDEDLLGFVMFELEDGAFTQDATRGLIYNVFVTPAERNHGIGSALLEAAVDRLGAVGADVVALEVLAANDGARRLYERLGFAPHRIEFERPVENDMHSSEDS